MHLASETFLDHVKWLRRAARKLGADLILAGDSMHALLRRGDARLVLQPQFLMSTPEGTRRTPVLHDASHAFLGWLPYASKHWPIAIDRLAFKRFAAEAGLPVPALSATSTATDVVVRKVAPAFEPWLAGPFRRTSERPLDPKGGEFYEAFVEGDALTVWFWDGRPICAEIAPSPFVVGDGTARLGDLIVRDASDAGASPHEMRGRLAEGEMLARFHGHSLSAALPTGVRVSVGHGHGSPLAPLRARSVFDLVQTADAPWLPLMRRAGPLLHAAVPEPIRSGTLFCMNATLDAKGQAWLLDVDASPRVHPLTYLSMLETLLPGATGSAAAPN
jgi:hypothetical protein